MQPVRRTGTLHAGMVRNVRETDGYTLALMGKELGCSAQFLSDVEHARRTVSPKLAARWAKARGYHPVSGSSTRSKPSSMRPGSSCALQWEAA